MDLAILVALTILLFGIPLSVLAIVLCMLYRVAFPIKRQLPEDLPNELFDGKAADVEITADDEAATSEFKKSFGARARKRFAAILERFNAYFFIEKRY